MREGEDGEVGQAGQAGWQVGEGVVVEVEFPQEEAAGKTSGEVGEAVVGKVEAFEAGLQPVQGVGQLVQAIASEGEEVEGGERGETGWKLDQLVVAEIEAVQGGEAGERGWQAGQVVSG